MTKKNKDNDIIVSFLGNSKDEVTGSCVSLSYPKNNNERGLIVLECGLVQGDSTMEKQYLSNKKMIDNIGKDVINNAEYVIICHSHVDHIGSLPIFNDLTNEFKGKILSSYKTMNLSKELIKDSVYIHKRNIEYLKSKGKKYKSLYTEQDMYNMFDHMDYVEIGKEIKLNDNLTIILNNNNHCLGSTNITLIFKKPNGNIKKICYTSDMGTNNSKDFNYYLEEQNIPNKCNLFISEATYCDNERQFTRQDVIKEREDLKQTIKNSILQGKRVLLPTFSFSRSQYLVTLLYKWFKDEDWFKNIPVIMDGVLMNNINDVYKRILKDENKELFNSVMNWNNIKFNRNFDGTVASLSTRTVGVYIASSGFLEAGRITFMLPQFLGCSKDIIIITGYCGGEGSLGWKLLNTNQQTITIDKKVYQKRAEIKSYKTFSSHITHDELLKLFSEINCDKILIHHSGNKKFKFIEEAKEFLLNKNKTTKIIGVGKENGYQFVL